MDYELKYVVAFCLIVKIAAFSPQFSISNDTTKNFSGEESLRLPSLASEEILPLKANQGTRLHQTLEDKSLKHEGVLKGKYQNFEQVSGESIPQACKEILQIFKHPLKWKQIQKTLRWLDKVFTWSNSSMRLCQTNKVFKKVFDAYVAKENFSFPRTRKKLERRKPSGFQKKKNSNRLILHRARDLINSPKSNIYLKRNKKLRKERKYKHKSRENRLKNKGVKEKRKGKFGKLFHKKNLKKHKNHLSEVSNSTILKPNSVLFDWERVSYGKNKKETECQIVKYDFEYPYVKVSNDCNEDVKIDEKGIRTIGPNKSLGSRGEGAMEDKPKPKTKAQKPKEKAWPHFIYHRVSSNFLPPDIKDQSHHPSAFVAISVASTNSEASEKQK